jgi:hypothetical protein
MQQQDNLPVNASRGKALCWSGAKQEAINQSFVVSPGGSRAGQLMRVAVLALCCWALVVPVSRAQEGGFPEFLQHLFGLSARPAPPPHRNAKPDRPRAKRGKGQDYVPSSRTREASGAGARVEPTTFVTVLGDSLAMMAAHGLSDAFANRPEVSIASVARDQSGLTRDDYYDWPKTARDLAASKKEIDLAVVMLGINDIQPMKDGGETLDPLSDKWRAIYAQRVEEVVTPFRDAHITALWVGLPPMPDERFNAEAIALNEIYRDNVEKAGGRYVDIWDGFADQNGQYSAFGPDVYGQNARLRSAANGIYFTKAGMAKLAQYLEADIRRALDKGKTQNDIAALPPDIEQEADDINAEIRREMGVDKDSAKVLPSPPKPEVGPILSLTARPVALNAELLNALSPSLGVENQSVRLGQTTPAQLGRADDFSWPRRK